MKLNLEEICSSTDHVGKRYFICDYRKPDLHKKAIRNVKPTEIQIVSDQDYRDAGIVAPTVYYSNVGFAQLNKQGEVLLKKLISPYDTTGYRTNTGIGINVFDNLEECVEFYNNQIDIVLNQYDEYIQVVVDRLNSEYNEIEKLKK